MERNGYAINYEWLKGLIYRGLSRKIFNTSYMHICLSRYKKNRIIESDFTSTNEKMLPIVSKIFSE